MGRNAKKCSGGKETLECGGLPPLAKTRKECAGLGAGVSKSGGKPPHSKVPAVCGLLLLAVIAVYGQTAGHDFVNFDDDDYVYKNQYVTGGLTRTGISWAFTQFHVAAHWHPLTWISLMADAQILKSKPGPPDRARLAAGMHLVNAAMHAANTLLLFLLLRAMTASLWRSAFVAAVFAVHPLHVESVAWVTERKDVLSGLFGLLALWAYCWYARSPSVFRYLAVAAALALGLMAKPMLVTWPLLFLLLDYWPLGRAASRERAGHLRSGSGSGEQRAASRERGAGRISLRALIVEKIPLLLLVSASATVTFLAQRAGGTVVSLESVSIPQRIARAGVLYVDYLGKTVWPANLAAVYPVTPLESPWPAVGAWVLLGLLTAGTLWGAWRGQRWLAVGWFWYLGTLAPTIGLIQVGPEVMADRFLYLPQIGICVAAAWGAADLAGRWPGCRWLLAALSAMSLASLLACAWRQTSYWQNSERLWTRSLACNADNSIAHTSLGNMLAEEGRIDEAIVHYRRTVEIQPDRAEAHLNLGNALARRGDANAAIAQYGEALKIAADYVEAHINLAVTLAGCGQTDAAIAHYLTAIELRPDDAQAHHNLANLLAVCGRPDEAIVHYRKVVELQPDCAEDHNNLGVLLKSRGEIAEAITHYRKALETDPDYADAHKNLGNVLAEHGQAGEAVEHYRKALALATVRNNKTLAEFLRARIELLQPAAPAGSAP
jgi:tetratricopeptide (TPR) repeat protein